VPGPAGVGMFALIAALIQGAIARTAGSQAGRLIGVGIAADVGLDWLRQRAIELAPGSDAAALEEAARMTARMLGLENDEVLWPRHRDGTPVAAKYFTIDLDRGRAWIHGRYYSRKSVQAAKRPRFPRYTYRMAAGRGRR